MIRLPPAAAAAGAVEAAAPFGLVDVFWSSEARCEGESGRLKRPAAGERLPKFGLPASDGAMAAPTADRWVWSEMAPREQLESCPTATMQSAAMAIGAFRVTASRLIDSPI